MLGVKWKGVRNVTGTTIGANWTPKYSSYCQCVSLFQKGKIHKDGLQPIACKLGKFRRLGN